MKTKILSSIIIATTFFLTLSFSPIMKKEINSSESQVLWKGKKITGSHNGTIAFKSGFVTMEGEQLTGGEFVIDMTSINVTDLSGESKAKLEGHLKSDDFFGVDTYPTATLKIQESTKIEGGYNVSGDITIKGQTQPVSFNLKMINNTTATTSLVIDRTKFGVRYGSGSFFDNLGDNTIYDDFELDVTLKF